MKMTLQFDGRADRASLVVAERLEQRLSDLLKRSSERPTIEHFLRVRKLIVISRRPVRGIDAIGQRSVEILRQFDGCVSSLRN